MECIFDTANLTVIIKPRYKVKSMELYIKEKKVPLQEPSLLSDYGWLRVLEHMAQCRSAGSEHARK